MPEVEQQQTDAALTDFQKWDALPEDEQIESADTEAAEPEEEEAAEVETEPESAPEEEQEPTAEDEEELPKGLKKRFRKLTGKIRDLETQLATRAAVPEVKQEPAAPQPKKPVEGEPKIEDFEDFADYNRAQVKYLLNQERAAEQQQEQARRAETEARERQAAFQARVKDVKTRIADYDEVLSGSDVQVSATMHDAILTSDIGPDLIYHLAKHPAEAKRIKALPPRDADREMLRLELKLAPQATETKPAVSKAPKPPKPVGGGAAVSDPGKEPDPRDFVKWSKWKDKQEARDRD